MGIVLAWGNLMGWWGRDSICIIPWGTCPRVYGRNSYMDSHNSKPSCFGGLQTNRGRWYWAPVDGADWLLSLSLVVE